MIYLNHQLIEAKGNYIQGMYFCTICGVQLFIGSENNLYKGTSYDGIVCYYDKIWVKNNYSCEEMQIKKLLE